MSSNVKDQKSIVGLRANAAAFLVTISYFIGLGVIFSVLALILEKDNAFVRNYSKQTLALSIVVLVGASLNIIVVIGTLIYFILFAILSIIQVVAAVNAAIGKEFKIPYLEKIMNLLFIED